MEGNTLRSFVGRAYTQRISPGVIEENQEKFGPA
jgi:hypothetical protein